MNENISSKIRTYFAPMAIYKDPNSTDSLFAGRNLPAFVKDYLLKRFINSEGVVDRGGLTTFLNKVIPQDPASVKDRLGMGEEITLLTRFTIYIDLVKSIRRFSIPDLGIKLNEGQIPPYIYEQNKGELVDGEKWGIIKLCLMPDEDGKKNHVEMVDFKPFKPYRSVDIAYLREARKSFTTEEWIDVLISAMEYDADTFASMQQKLEFLTRLFIFIEPRLNVIELAPKGTGKSYVFGNLSKYGWIISGGKVTRAKLLYDKAKEQLGILCNHDYTAFDEIPLNENKKPINYRYFDSLPNSFRESALLDRFHCFIEGWYLPRISKNMIYKGWTINVEYFSEVMHALRTENVYGMLFDQLVEYEANADMRDFKAVKRIATAAMKLFFPHWKNVADVDLRDFDTYCLQPAIYRRGIIKTQCHHIDPEFKTQMPYIHVKGL